MGIFVRVKAFSTNSLVNLSLAIVFLGSYGAAPEFIILILDKSYLLTIGSFAKRNTTGGTTKAKVHLYF